MVDLDAIRLRTSACFCKHLLALLEKQLRDSIDDPPRQRADHGSVDPNKLQVTTDVQFDPPTGLLGVPALDRLGDDRCDLHSILRDQMLGCPNYPVVDLVAQVGVVTQ